MIRRKNREDSAGAVIGAAFSAPDDQPMDLVFIGVQQDGLAMPASVVDRVVARPQGWRRIHYMADARRFDHSQGYALVHA